jgi:type IX secretion system PorP/SprF family membrane protein
MKKLIAFLTAFNLLQHAGAQVDAHFSQFYAHPLWLNPALTGAFDGSVRVTGIYRNQWSSLMTPFSTGGFSADVVAGHNIQLGMSILNQTAGDAGYRFTNATLSVSYSGIRFGQEGQHAILIGMQGGLLNRRFDPSRFQFGNQWNSATGFDAGTPSGDYLSKVSGAALDLGAGIAWTDVSEDQGANGFAGFSVSHMTQPTEPFIAGSRAHLPMRITLHGGVRININDEFTLTPHFLYLQQGEADERLIGAQAKWFVGESSSLIAGLNYRFDDAVIPMVGLAFNRFTLGLSYDNTISNLGKVAGGANAFEVSLSFVLPREEGREIPCPRF